MDSKEFKKIRTDNNITQEGLSNFLRCSKSAVEKIEGGAEIKNIYILEVMKSIKRWGLKDSPEECLSELEKFKFDCASTVNSLLNALELGDDIQEVRDLVKQAASYLSTAIELI